VLVWSTAGWPDTPGMNDIELIARRINALREPHREHAIKRIEHMLEGVEDHEAEFAARVTVPMRCPPGV
jgi:hypothetical protein